MKASAIIDCSKKHIIVSTLLGQMVLYLGLS